MYYLRFSRLIICSLLIFIGAYSFSAEENFILINGVTGQTVLKQGPHINEPITPGSTFKIVLSLMGYNAEILKSEMIPVWDYQEGYDNYLASWQAPQTPLSWMKNSCVWYSKILALHLGLEKVQNYLALFDYGNQDMSGGLTNAWLSSSLKISSQGQVDFIQKMITRRLPISSNAFQKTKELLFLQELPQEWKLFGKTGWGSIIEQDGRKLEVGWFVGWVEKNDLCFPFAYTIRDSKVNLDLRIPRVKQLLKESNILHMSSSII